MFSSRSSELMFSVIVLSRVTLAIVDYLLSLVFFISQIVFGGDTDQRIVVTVLDILVFDDRAGVKTKSCAGTVGLVFAGIPRQSVCCHGGHSTQATGTFRLVGNWFTLGVHTVPARVLEVI